MANMFSNKIDKQVPKTLKECVQPDATVANLHTWAERLEKWGQILFYVLIGVGVFSTIMDTISAVDIDDELAFTTLLTSAVTWGLYAFIEYCVYHVLALLISALASITQNTIITANVALLEASQKTDLLDAEEKTSEKAVNKAAPMKPKAPVQQTTADAAVSTPKQTQETAPKQKETKSFADHLRYSLKYQTDDGLQRYLQGVMDELPAEEKRELEQILAASRKDLRTTVNDYLKTKDL